jgi:hypothetical protein
MRCTAFLPLSVISANVKLALRWRSTFSEYTNVLNDRKGSPVKKSVSPLYRHCQHKKTRAAAVATDILEILQQLCHCVSLTVCQCRLIQAISGATSYVQISESPSEQPSELVRITFETRAAVAHAEERVPEGTDSSSQGCLTIVALLSAVFTHVHGGASCKMSELGQHNGGRKSRGPELPCWKLTCPLEGALITLKPSLSLAFPLSRVQAF